MFGWALRTRRACPSAWRLLGPNLTFTTCSSLLYTWREHFFPPSASLRRSQLRLRSNGENKRTIGQPKVNSLIINSLINELYELIYELKEEDSELWFVETQLHTISIGHTLYVLYHINIRATISSHAHVYAVIKTTLLLEIQCNTQDASSQH